MKRITERTADGSFTLFVPDLDEHYHSVKGAQTESEYIFIEKGYKASEASSPKVLEIGFGTGLNALLTLEAADKIHRQTNYTGIELYPLSWEEIKPLGYSTNPLFEQIHHIPWNIEVKLTECFILEKIKADVNTVFKTTEDRQTLCTNNPVRTDSEHTLTRQFDVVYFDAFAPEKQPEMWNVQLLRSIYVNMNKDGILTTYCAKGTIRRMLQSTGFKVERLPGPPGGKREILRAIKE